MTGAEFSAPTTANSAPGKDGKGEASFGSGSPELALIEIPWE